MQGIFRVNTLAAATLFSLGALSGNAVAGTVAFNTNAAGTGFGGTSLTLNSNSGQAATLRFIAALNVVTATPSNVNYGNFTLVCTTCSTQALGNGSTFAPFSFSMVVTDITESATGKFTGTSSGGTVFSDLSGINISWLPLTLGPGASNALTGNFGPTTFVIGGPTNIVAPNSGAVPGQTTVEGFVTSATITTIPIPGAALFMLSGLALFGVVRARRSAAAA